jgi:hypothetical protein
MERSPEHRAWAGAGVLTARMPSSTAHAGQRWTSHGNWHNDGGRAGMAGGLEGYELIHAQRWIIPRNVTDRYGDPG